jgi:hypothetical protein
MALLSGIRLDPRTEAVYRRGYIRGVEDLLGVLQETLPRKQLDALRTWAERDLEDWRQSPTTGREDSPEPPSLAEPQRT